jgi:hypothetical protein
VQVISGKFLGDFQRHYDEKGYKIFDWIFQTNPACPLKIHAIQAKNRELAADAAEKPDPLMNAHGIPTPEGGKL